MMYDAVAMGELLIDFTCASVDAEGYPTMSAHPGGAPANFLAALSKFGAKTAMLGKVGNDAFGRLLKNTLGSVGIDARGLGVDEDYFTTLAFVTLDAHGDREFSFARKPGADTQLTAAELDYTLIDSARLFHFGTLSLTAEPTRAATLAAVAYAKEHGKLISFDPNLRRPLWADLAEAKRWMLWGLEQADIVKISDEEVGFLFDVDKEHAAEYIVGRFDVKLCFVTCGAEGSYYATAAQHGHTPALSGLQIVDTTGAGDIFGGSAAYALLKTDTTPEKLSAAQLFEITAFATAAAGLSTQKHGGISSVPDYMRVTECMKSLLP